MTNLLEQAIRCDDGDRAAKTAARNECAELEASSNPTHWVKAVKREAEEDWERQ